MSNTLIKKQAESSLATVCPVCKADQATPVIERQDVPVFCNALAASESEACDAARGDLRLVSCTSCGLVYNAAFDVSRVNYAVRYENAQHFSPRFQQHLADVAKQLVSRYQIRLKHVVDIGCGDGRFLDLICAEGRNHGLGCDPAAPPADASDNPDIVIVRKHFDDETARGADLVCCRHVLEHIDQPREFVGMVRRTLEHRRDALVYFEVPNVMSMLRDLSVWEALYEHCLYFGRASLVTLFSSCGFNVVETWESFGGQFLSLVARPTSIAHVKNQKAEVDEQAELVAQYARQFKRLLQLWNDRLADLNSQGRRIFIWGGGTRGVMFLNTVPAARFVRGVIDVNPRKRGSFVAGTGHPIYAPCDLSDLEPDVVVVMNAAYKDEIQEELKRVAVPIQLLTVEQ